MLYGKKEKTAGWAFGVYLLLIGLALGLFFVRYIMGAIPEDTSDGTIKTEANAYQFGTVYDTNGATIVTGTSTGVGNVSWGAEGAEKAFADFLGIGLLTDNEDGSYISKYTLIKRNLYLYGVDDDRLTLKGLVTPWKPRIGGSVWLTLDMDLQIYISELADAIGVEDVSIVVSNYATGEILAVCGNVQEELRHPGSTIKPILAAAVLSIYPEMADFTYECKEGNHTFTAATGEKITINCYGGEYHGTMNMEDAMAKSCNGYFVALLEQINREELCEELEKWGFDTEISYTDFVYSDHQFLSGSENAAVDYLMGAIGQATAMTTTLGMNICTNAILNHGTLMEPYLVKAAAYSYGSSSTDLTDREVYEICSEEVADAVISMMAGVTEYGTGRSFAYQTFVAKTGTATKSNTDDSGTIWTTGGLTDEATPYSVTVCLDDVSGDMSSSVAGNLAKQILEYMTGGEE